MQETGTWKLKTGLAQMLKGGVIMDVINAEQAKIAEDAGACSVMALERVPSDIRAAGGVVADAITSKTTLLVAGEKAGSKRADAERLGVRIVDEAGFLALLGKSAAGE